MEVNIQHNNKSLDRRSDKIISLLAWSKLVQTRLHILKINFRMKLVLWSSLTEGGRKTHKSSQRRGKIVLSKGGVKPISFRKSNTPRRNQQTRKNYHTDTPAPSHRFRGDPSTEYRRPSPHMPSRGGVFTPPLHDVTPGQWGRIRGAWPKVEWQVKKVRVYGLWTDRYFGRR